MHRTALRQAKPTNPFAGDRGIAGLPTGRLLTLRNRYLAWQAQVEAERGTWPPPDTAALYVAAVLAEIDAALTAREAVAA